MAAARKKLPGMAHPLIEAAVSGLYCFQSLEIASRKLEELRKRFTISSLQLPQKTGAPPSLILWIRGYALTGEEVQQGYKGNFALIAPEKRHDGWTLAATKLEWQLEMHPSRGYHSGQKHPNWRHPALRAAKAKKWFLTMEEAEELLALLHRDFPETTIPGRQKLYAIIYTRDKTEAEPIRKYLLEVKPFPEGGFYIDCQLNIKRPRQEIATTPKQPVGHFSAMVQRRARKRRTPVRNKRDGGQHDQMAGD